MSISPKFYDVAELALSCKKAFAEATTAAELEAVRVQFLGRKSDIVLLLKSLDQLTDEERRSVAPKLQQARRDFEQAYQDRMAALEDMAQNKIPEQKLDVTAYRVESTHGALHPLTELTERIEDIFMRLGWSIAEGPEVEDAFHNFEALNIPAHHPAREDHDTFWLTQDQLLLRTHTSSVEIRTLELYRPPLAVCAPGRCYRHEATDATHDFVFRQCEGLFVDRKASLTNLTGVLTYFMQELFEKKDLAIRLRPGYFPFVEPGLEVDITCPFCKQGCSVCKKTGWIELGGAGLTHPNVLKACGLDPHEWNGFAFGFGIERLGQLLYRIPDIRLFKTGKLQILQQFSPLRGAYYKSL